MVKVDWQPALFLAVFALFGCGNQASDICESYEASWMTSWATTGQIMTALINTDIPADNDVDASFKSFLFGPAMNEAALAGAVQATNTGIVPTINLLAASDDWVIVSRLITFPVAIVVPEASDIDRIETLRGKRVGVPFGGGSHPYILQRLEEHGLSAGSGPDEVELVNLRPPEQVAAYRSGDVDAVATWEPQTAIARAQKPSRILDRDYHVGFLSVHRDLVEHCSDELADLLRAYRAAMLYVAQNRNRTDQWFLKVSQFDPDLLKRIEVVEENLNASELSDVRLVVTTEEANKTQEVADIMYKHGLTPQPVSISERLDMSFLPDSRNFPSGRGSQ